MATTYKLCGICSKPLDVRGDASSEDCGGDCVECMAEAGDHDCQQVMYQVLKHRLAVVMEPMESAAPRPVRPVAAKAPAETDPGYLAYLQARVVASGFRSIEQCIYLGEVTKASYDQKYKK